MLRTKNAIDKLSELYHKDEYQWRRKMIERIDKGQELDLEHIKTLLIEMECPRTS